MFGHRAVGRFGRVGQGVEYVLLGLLWIDGCQGLGHGRGQRQGVEQQRRLQFVGIECLFSLGHGCDDRLDGQLWRLKDWRNSNWLGCSRYLRGCVRRAVSDD
ncbi:hypothetical protein D3C73_1199540 [compost metagenome]